MPRSCSLSATPCSWSAFWTVRFSSFALKPPSVFHNVFRLSRSAVDRGARPNPVQCAPLGKGRPRVAPSSCLSFIHLEREGTKHEGRIATTLSLPHPHSDSGQGGACHYLLMFFFYIIFVILFARGGVRKQSRDDKRVGPSSLFLSHSPSLALHRATHGSGVLGACAPYAEPMAEVYPETGLVFE